MRSTFGPEEQRYEEAIYARESGKMRTIFVAGKRHGDELDVERLGIRRRRIVVIAVDAAFGHGVRLQLKGRQGALEVEHSQRRRLAVAPALLVAAEEKRSQGNNGD